MLKRFYWISAVAAIVGIYAYAFAGFGYGRVVSGQAVSSGGVAGGAWYYSAGSDNYTNTYSSSDNEMFGADVTPGVSGTITKLSVKVGTPYPDLGCDIRLLKNTGSWVQHSCKTSAEASAAGWVDVDLTGAEQYAIGGAETVIVQFACDDRQNTFYVQYGSTSGGYYNTNAYPMCGDAVSLTSSWEFAVRVWVE